ncbi:hypothetical protein POVCU2_0025200 [Plasmodium ovale curtisi]|uniref:Uncharacterized protein n=1 Tax=Plasmodium ovale curtisi TaxID=864141 RepID=A0A1A8VZE1_PLAOA|nr:hypothetical protein POVCU2_0025200 [Plasmodium ovale curtisi]SBS92451.1 hypothetical protein POVCU1_023060 [Plasmodium ovale curtisi]
MEVASPFLLLYHATILPQPGHLHNANVQMEKKKKCEKKKSLWGYDVFALQMAHIRLANGAALNATIRISNEGKKTLCEHLFYDCKSCL